MEIEKYIKCAKCAGLYNYKDNHYEKCTIDEYFVNYKDGINICCYICGKEDVRYSSYELENPECARCVNCEADCRTKRTYKYDYLWSAHTNQVHKLSLDRQLMYYVRKWNLLKMREILEKGANPNFEFRQDYYRGHGHFYLLYYNADGTEMNTSGENNLINQSPLRHCIEEFRFCDSDDQRNKIIEMAKLLIEFGANVIEEKIFFESYLGKYQNKEDGLRHVFYSLFE